MLIYVNKKQQRRKRIKLLSLVLFCVFVVSANIIYFQKKLHTSTKNLANYTPIATYHNWFNSAQNITLFSSKDNPYQKIIVIPQSINRETSLTLAYVLSKISDPLQLEFTPEVKNQAYIKELTLALYHTPKSKSKTLALITTNIDNINKQIYKQKLFPTVINYQQAQKIKNNNSVMNLINNQFPTPELPQNTLAIQQASIQKFATLYRNELQQIPQTPNYKNLSSHGFFLQNINLCIQTINNKICVINNSTSFKKNLDNALKQIQPNEKIIKLSLLTSSEEISQNTLLEQDDGIIFRYGIREKILLPSEVTNLLKKQQNPYNILKKLAGLNYYYETNNMKFYKFKIVEIDIHDKI